MEQLEVFVITIERSMDGEKRGGWGSNPPHPPPSCVPLRLWSHNLQNFTTKITWYFPALTSCGVFFIPLFLFQKYIFGSYITWWAESKRGGYYVGLLGVSFKGRGGREGVRHALDSRPFNFSGLQFLDALTRTVTLSQLSWMLYNLHKHLSHWKPRIYFLRWWEISRWIL